jgi:hypothetical protein
LVVPSGVAPAGFEHCWDRFPVEFKVFVSKQEAFGKKFVAGRATMKELLESLLSTPPKLRAAFAQTPSGAIYLPENFAIVETFYAALYGPRNAANSQFAAQFKTVGKCLRIDLQQHFGKIVAGLFNIGKHYETGMPVREESKQTYDIHLRLLAAIGVLCSTIPPLFAARCHLAKVERDSQFTRSSNRAFNECPDSPPKDLLASLGVSQLRQVLLKWWCEIPGYDPRFGLADFTYKAAGQFCSLIFDPQGKRKGDPFDGDKVREVVRSLRLVKRDRAATDLAVEGGQVVLTLKSGQRVPFARR